MAEAVVEGRQRFFCHLCSVEIDHVSLDYTCPRCAGGFIEELPSLSAADQPRSTSIDVDMSDDEGFYVTNNRLQDELNSILRSVINPMMDVEIIEGSGSGANTSIGDDAGTLSATSSQSDTTVGNNSGVGNTITINTPNNDGPFGIRRFPHRRSTINVSRMEVDEFLRNIVLSASGLGGTNVGTGTSGQGATFSAPMFFMGNPNDYAWGREGLDTIVTQLINQMDSTGPPPLAKDKIAEIPKVDVTSEQVGMKLQCSICWEDFQLEEIVRKLPCLHIYHENCIIPWLELHGTCPVCRKNVSDDVEDDQQQQTVGSINLGNSPIVRLTNIVASRNPTQRPQQTETQTQREPIQQLSQQNNTSAGGRQTRSTTRRLREADYHDDDAYIDYEYD